MTAPPRPFDRDLHRRRLMRAAEGFGAADFLRQRASDDLVERLAAIRRDFSLAIDLGARTGVFAAALARAALDARPAVVVETDLAAAMLRRRPGPRVVADEERLPFADGAVDLIVSGLALHWVNDLVGTLVQVRRILRPDGLFLGAMLGGATLTELRQVLTEAEVELTGGAGPRVSPFVDAADAGDLLRRAGFALPVVDVDRLSVRYDHLLALLADLRAMGETSALYERPRAGLTRAVLGRAGALYQQRFADASGRIAATFEIITLTGWAPHPAQPRPLRRGSGQVSLEDALASARTGSPATTHAEEAKC
jgi:SAM-dependent methyltransferase